MMTYPPHLAVRPNRVNKPAGPTLENFCLELGERLRAFSLPIPLNYTLLADELRASFNLLPPVGNKLMNLLDEWEIDCTTSETIFGEDPACYLYNQHIGQWQICLRENAGVMESIHILHELYEFIWWRCYYLIPEWKEWAIYSKIDHPHDQAEAFARNIVFNPSAFGQIAKTAGFNPLTLSSRYNTAPGICFQQFMHLSFPIPYIQFRLNFAAIQTQPTFQFDENPAIQAAVFSKGTKFHDSLNQAHWREMFALREGLPGKDSFVSVDDWICKAVRSRLPAAREVTTLLGVRLPAPVFVVVRPNYQKAFVQVVSVKKRELLIDPILEEMMSPSCHTG